MKDEDEILQCKMKDLMWQKFGIELEDYNLAIAKHNLIDDPEVQKRTEQVNSYISQELRDRLIEPLF